MHEGITWENKSKQLLKSSINRRIRSIIGVSMEVIEKNIPDKVKFDLVRGAVMKVCNDISRKICDDLDSYTVKKNRYNYFMPFIGGDENVD